MGSLGEAVLDLKANANTLDSGLTEGKNKVTGAMDGLNTQAIRVGTMLGNLGAQAVSFLGQQIVAAGKESLNKFLDYAEKIQQVQRALGTNVDEAARLIQVADDVGVAYESMTQAMALASKNGIEVNIEGLAKLADEYVKLAPGVERAEFAADKFGRGWQAMVPILEKGGDGIRKINDGIAEGLLPTEEAIRQAEEYKIAVDNLSEAWEQFVYRVAPKILEWTNKQLNDELDLMRAREMAKEAGIGMWDWIGEEKIQEFISLARAEREAATEAKRLASANEDATGSFEASTSAIDDNKAAIDEANTAYDEFKNKLDEVSRTNREAESFIQSYADFQKDYSKNHKQAIDEVAEAEKELAEARKKYGQDFISNAQKLGFAQSDLNEAVKKYGAASEEAFNAREKISNIKDAQGDDFKGLDKVFEKLQDAQQGVKDLEASWHESTQKMIYDMVLAKVSVDGLTDAEFNATQDLAVQMGIRTQADADAAKKMMETATSLAAGIALQEDVMKQNLADSAELARLEDQKKAAIAGTTTTITGTATAQDKVTTAAQSTTAEVDKTENAQGDMARAVQTTVTEVQRETQAHQLADQTVLKIISDQNRLTQAVKVTTTAYQAMARAAQALSSYSVPRSSSPNYQYSSPAGPTQPQSRSNHTNVTINNPVAEPASRSVDKTLKKLSYLGVLK